MFLLQHRSKSSPGCLCRGLRDLFVVTLEGICKAYCSSVSVSVGTSRLAQEIHHLRPTRLLTAPKMQAFNGSMVYWYNSTSYRDDLTWAAAWLFKATADPGYLADAYAFWTTHTNQEGIWDLRYLVSPSVSLAHRPLSLQLLTTCF